MGRYKKGHHAGIEAAFNFMRKALYIHKVLAEKISMVYARGTLRSTIFHSLRVGHFEKKQKK
jgi:hypothetical protein